MGAAEQFLRLRPERVLGSVYIHRNATGFQPRKVLIQGWKMEASLDSHDPERGTMGPDCTRTAGQSWRSRRHGAGQSAVCRGVLVDRAAGFVTQLFRWLMAIERERQPEGLSLGERGVIAEELQLVGLVGCEEFLQDQSAEQARESNKPGLTRWRTTLYRRARNPANQDGGYARVIPGWFERNHLPRPENAAPAAALVLTPLDFRCRYRKRGRFLWWMIIARRRRRM